MKLRHDATDTSVKAAIAAYPRAGTQRARILNLLFYWDSGLTDAQIQSYLQIPESSQRPRRVELVEQGWLEDSGQRRTWNGHGEAIVWQLTEQAKRGVA